MNIEAYYNAEGGNKDDLSKDPENDDMGSMGSKLLQGYTDISKNNDREEEGCFQKLRRCLARNARMIKKRRLTTDKEGHSIGSKMTEMHPQNIKRLKNAYKHPFEKISMDYYFEVQKVI